jgi:plastocyanin
MRAVAPLMLAAALLVTAAPAGGQTREPGRVQVVAKEFRLLPSRYVLRAGPTIVELVNAGEDPHDLAIRRIARGARTFHVPVVQPGGLKRVTITLRPGSYDVWCALPTHRSLGMVTRLVVR